jgi:hypothetical protein
MYGAVVTLADPAAPTLGTPTGPLWGAGEAGIHKGTESVTVVADDIGGGVRSVALLADGRQMANFAATCDFTRAQPCPSATSPQVFALPTAQLSDGTHTVEVVATDAAGNQVVQSERIFVQNAPPPPLPGASIATTPTTMTPGTTSAMGTNAASVHLSESLKGRKLIVRVSARAIGRVRVGFTGRLHGRVVATGAKTIALRNGTVTTTFKLGPRAAAHALIRVSARLDHGHTVTRTLRRRDRPHA